MKVCYSVRFCPLQEAYPLHELIAPSDARALTDMVTEVSQVKLTAVPLLSSVPGIHAPFPPTRPARMKTRCKH